MPSTTQTIAIFTPAAEGGFDVQFPGYPGCVTFGRTLQEAKRMAREVLALWIEELEASETVRYPKIIIADVPLPRSRKNLSHRHYEAASREKTRAHS